MRYIVASVVVLTTVLAGALTVAGAGEPVKPLAGFEPAEVQKWGWKEKDGGYAYSDSGGARGQTAKGEAGLAKRCQDLLDERAMAIVWAREGSMFGEAGWLGYAGSGWQERAARLFAAAAEVAGKPGGK